MTTLVIADTHCGHWNINKYCNRGFANVDEMDEAIIASWNRVVAPEDTVYVLGDFAFRSNPGKYFHRLNGAEKYLIMGNHDGEEALKLPWTHVYGGRIKKKAKIFPSVGISIDNQYMILSHFAGRTWDASHKTAWSLWGHSHAMLVEDAGLSFDVGWDAWGEPISIGTVRRKMEWKKKNGAPVLRPHTEATVRAFNRQFIVH